MAAIASRDLEFFAVTSRATFAVCTLSTRDMSAISNLCNEVVFDHIKNVRNYRVMEDADRTAEGVNTIA